MPFIVQVVLRLTLIFGLTLPQIPLDARVFMPLLMGRPGEQTAGTRDEQSAPISDEGEAVLQAAPNARTFPILPHQAAVTAHDAVSLRFEPNAVDQETIISITSLAESDLPALDQGMTNVTQGPRRGYRFLPHMQFKNNLVVQMPYNPRLIPNGMSEHDVRTYFFNEAAGVWQALELVEVDTRNKVVTSLTDHFTDMINAVVVVPDHPQTMSYNPTSIKDIQAAEPGIGITLIDPPSASARGDARLLYPFQLPPGRNGMTPGLGLSYNSSGGNGWLGLGWSLGVPSVGIDTRWGVPRYDPTKETETYLLDGGQLAPVVHRNAAFVDRSGPEKVFHSRVEGTFRRIVRHGQGPADYWWQVTERNGTVSIFGDTPATRLTDDAGNIYQWMLREVRDANGNRMLYTYAHDNDPGIVGGSVPGKQVYLKSINYTGHVDGQGVSTAGAYTVTFVRDAELPGWARRPDVSIDGRGGFKMVTAHLLKRIHVTFDSGNGVAQPVRHYELSYTEGAFGKTLLQKVAQFGELGGLFHEHVFDYYDRVRNGNQYVGFADAEPWQTHTDNVGLNLLGGLVSLDASALGGSVNDTKGVHLYVGFNFGSPTKPLSIGGKVGGVDSDTEGLLALVDLNGDNLPDKVFKQGNQVYMRLNESGPSGAERFSDEVHGIGSLNTFFRESSSTFSYGPEAYIGLSLLDNTAHTFSATTIYFTDVNGDGLPDLVVGGGVLFNRLENGIPVFTPDSSLTPAPIASGAVDGNGIVPDFTDIFEQAVDNFPLHDTLRRWTAPFAGTIQITGDVALLENTSPAREHYQTADGVRVAIQRNGEELWHVVIPATDYGPKTPQNVASVPVQKGDRIYFRVGSIFDGAYDEVAWSPVVEYTSIDQPAPDANGQDQRLYAAAQDFVLAGRRDIFVQMPITGTVQLDGVLQKLGPTSDDIEVRVYKNDVLALAHPMAWDETGSSVPAVSFDVLPQDTVKLRIKVDSPIDVRQLQWQPELYYTAIEGSETVVDAEGQPLLQLFPPYDIDLYPGTKLTAPQQGFTASQAGSHTVQADLNMGAGLDATVNGVVVFTVKRPNELVAKQTILVVNGIANDASVNFDAEAGETFFFDFSVYDPFLAEKISSAETNVTPPNAQVGVPAPSALHFAVRPDAFPQPYRGWAYAGYNGNRAFATQPIVESRLVQDFENSQDYDPQTATVYLFNPIPGENRWRGPDDGGFVTATRISSSRLGPDAITVPRPEDFANQRAVPRVSRTRQQAAQVGVLGFSIAASGIGPDDGSFAELDYLDMNGDRYPDIVGHGRIQYTTPNGGLEATSTPLELYGPVRRSDAGAENYGLGGSVPLFKAGGPGVVDAPGYSKPGENNTGNQMVTLGLGLGFSVGVGESELDTDLQDINGDGLPDRVRRNGNNLEVALNLGYQFAPFETWGQGGIHAGESENLSLSANAILGINDGVYGFASGLSLTQSESKTNYSLQDINGDGLLDQVRPGANGLEVRLNTGTGFGAPVVWPSPFNELARDTSTSLGKGLYFTIGIGPLCLFACYVILNPGAHTSDAMARPEITLRDVDGDGIADHLASTKDNSLMVARNSIDETNLLKTVYRPMGATISLEYARNGNTVDNPHSQWVLARVDLFDGHTGDGVDTTTRLFQYEDGVYDRQEREFLGYGKVTEMRLDGVGQLYRRTETHYRTDSIFAAGLLSRTAIYDALDRLFTETLHTYTLKVVEGDESNPAELTIFPQHVASVERAYEGQAVLQISTANAMNYDAFGNLKTLVDVGDPGDADNLVATLTYSGEYVGGGDPALCLANHIVDVPTRIVVTDHQGQVLRRRESSVDCATGNVVQVREILADGSMAVTDLSYTPEGNLQTVHKPANSAGERYALTLAYDPVVRTHVAQVSDIFGYSSSSIYNLKFGLAVQNVDINGNVTSYTFDQFGRTRTVTGPYEQGAGKPTIEFEYHPLDAPVPWAITRHFDPFRSPVDTLDTVLFADGLQRTIQIKRDATIHTGANTPAEDKMIVSGPVVFDALGRVVEEYFPFTEPLGQAGIFNPGGLGSGVAPTRLHYDVLDRMTVVTRPDNVQVQTIYGLAQDGAGVTRYETTIIDANGNQQKHYRNARRLAVARLDLNATPNQPLEEIWTYFAYDPLRQLVEIVDDGGHVTTIEYDLFGRRTALTNPDAGRTEYAYDLASNLIAKRTANLALEDKQITYVYDINRLARIEYPNFPGNNVTYTYGEPGADHNRAGRVVLVADQSGTEERFYGKLGEVVKEVKTIASATQGNSTNSPEVYVTEYVYDTWNRLQKLVYPDGEVLTYQYDSGGYVRAAGGVKGGIAYAYVNRVEYNEFNQQVFIEMGNGVRTTMTYVPETRRLASLHSGKGGGNLFQNQFYAYDAVGNVRNVVNQVAAPASPAHIGGPVSQSFGYDGLNRLISAVGSFQPAPNKTEQYSLAMSYDTLHNIRSKKQEHQLVQPSGKVIAQRTSHDLVYTYAGPQPHAATQVGDLTYQYDANGNQLGYTHNGNGTGRTIVWDEENRIQSLSDNGHQMTYTYNDAGERVIKRGPQGEAVYVNSFFTIRNREVGSKHVFIGAQRYVSKLMKQPKPGGNGNGANPVEKDLYFYHTDHLGGTQYVTDSSGQVYEHVQYFPFGETWISQSNRTQQNAYLFTSKELDSETGLYYYGARYYDPRLATFLGVDPYFVETPEDAVRQAVGINLFAYTLHNPVAYTDPDGRNPISIYQGIRKVWDTYQAASDLHAAVDGYNMGLKGEVANYKPTDAFDGIIPGSGAQGNLIKFTTSRLGYMDRLQRQWNEEMRNAGKLTPEQRLARLNQRKAEWTVSLRKLSMQMSHAINVQEDLVRDLKDERHGIELALDEAGLTSAEVQELQADLKDVEREINKAYRRLDTFTAIRDDANAARQRVEAWVPKLKDEK